MLIPLWAACFGGTKKHESKWTWKKCAEQVKKGQLFEIYNTSTTFTDRAKGAPSFGEVFPDMVSLNCTLHIIKNARKAAPQSEKHFHDNMVWEMQGAKNEAEFFNSLGTMAKNFPYVADYLYNIDKKTWVHYAQINSGARTYGWRTSNIAEIGQSMFKTFRKLHPLNFFEAFAKVVFSKVGQAKADTAKWAEDPECSEANLVPFAIAKAKELSNVGKNTRVNQLDDKQFETEYMDSQRTHPTRCLDLTLGQCSCLQLQTYQFPCKDVFACGQKQGVAWLQLVKESSTSELLTASAVDSCYRLWVDPVSKISFTQFLAPDLETLQARRHNPFYAGVLSKIRQDRGIQQVMPPPVRVKEAHGNNKRKRKVAGQSGSMLTRNMAARQSEEEKQSKKARRLACTKCGSTEHRAPGCPTTVRDTIIVLASSSEDEQNLTEE